MFSLQHFKKLFNYLNTIRKHIAIAANETNEKKKNTGSGLTSRFEINFFFNENFDNKDSNVV